MAGREIRESVTVAGRAERARVARAFVAGVLGPGHPCGDDAALLVSEPVRALMTAAIRATARSRRDLVLRTRDSLCHSGITRTLNLTLTLG